jgi:hypothetical protein
MSQKELSPEEQVARGKRLLIYGMFSLVLVTLVALFLVLFRAQDGVQLHMTRWMPFYHNLPSTSRAMTSRWISLVPSPMVHSR